MDYTERLSCTGNPEQLAFARSIIIDEGQGKGLSAIEIDNGCGLTLMVMTGRGMDLGPCKLNGKNISFMGKNGLVSATHSGGGDGDFGRQFGGGLLFTSGLLNAGPPDKDVNGIIPLHGRLNMQEAYDVCKNVDYRNGAIEVSGKIREAMLFQHRIVVERHITVSLTENKVTLRDEISNEGFAPAGIMLLYHCNFGYPMLSDKAELDITTASVEPRDAEAAKDVAEWQHFDAPRFPYNEQVFYHTPAAAEDGFAHAVLTNPELGIVMEMTFKPEELPHMVEWKSMAKGDYALGLEPSTCFVGGRTAEEAAGRLVNIAPLQQYHAGVTFTFR